MTCTLVDCKCKWGERENLHRPPSIEQGLADYLRKLATRVEAGEMRHVSISAHLADGPPVQTGRVGVVG